MGAVGIDVEYSQRAGARAASAARGRCLRRMRGELG